MKVIWVVHEPIMCGAICVDRNVTRVVVTPPTTAGMSSFEGGAEHVGVKMVHVQALLHVRFRYVSGCTQAAAVNSVVPDAHDFAG